MSECIQQAGLGCSYVNVTTNDGNVTVFTWWLTLGRDHETDTMAIMEFTVLIIIMLIALIANLLVFVVIMSDKKMKKIPTHQYMATLCIDYISFISIAPMLLLTRRAYTWIFGKAMCKFILYIFAVSGFNTIWIYVLVSIDRFIQVVDAVEESRLTKFYPKNTIWAIVGFAIFGTLFFLPLILYFDIYTVIEDECTNSTQCYMGVMNSDIKICAVIWPESSASIAWFVFMLLLDYIVPLSLICYNYYRVYKTVRKTSKRIRTTRSKIESRTKLEIRVSRMILILISLFVLMWTPIFITLILIQFDRVKQKSDALISSDVFFWIFIMTLANAMITPILYGALNKKFVNSWKACRCRRAAISCVFLRNLSKQSNMKVQPTSESSSEKNKSSASNKSKPEEQRIDCDSPAPMHKAIISTEERIEQEVQMTKQSNLQQAGQTINQSNLQTLTVVISPPTDE